MIIKLQNIKLIFLFYFVDLNIEDKIYNQL